jgi:hypothetical protein
MTPADSTLGRHDPFTFQLVSGSEAAFSSVTYQEALAAGAAGDMMARFL